MYNNWSNACIRHAKTPIITGIKTNFFSVIVVKDLNEQLDIEYSDFRTSHGKYINLTDKTQREKTDNNLLLCKIDYSHHPDIYSRQSNN